MVDFLEELVKNYNKKLYKLSQKESEEIKNEILSIAKDMGVDISRLFADFDKKSATPPKIDAQKSPIQREKRGKRPASPKKEKTAIKPKEVAKKQVEKKSPEKPIKTEKKVSKDINSIKPIGKMGAGANIYFQSKKYRVNENSFKENEYYLNIQDKFDILPILNIKFNNPKDAVKIAEKLEEIYPYGVPRDFDYDKFVKIPVKKKFYWSKEGIRKVLTALNQNKSIIAKDRIGREIVINTRERDWYEDGSFDIQVSRKTDDGYDDVMESFSESNYFWGAKSMPHEFINDFTKNITNIVKIVDIPDYTDPNSKKEKTAPKSKEVAKKRVEKKSPEKPIKTEKKVEKNVDCGDTCLVKGIEFVRDNFPNGANLVRMAMEVGMIDPKRYNEFGKELLSVKELKDISRIINIYQNPNYKSPNEEKIKQAEKRVEERKRVEETPFQKRQSRPEYMKIFEKELDYILSFKSEFFGNIKYLSNINLTKKHQTLKLEMVAKRPEDSIKKSGGNPEIDLLNTFDNGTKKLYFYTENNSYSVEIRKVDLIEKIKLEKSDFAKYSFDIGILLKEEENPEYLSTKYKVEQQNKKFYDEVNKNSNWKIINSKVDGLVYYWNAQEKEMQIRHKSTGALLGTPTDNSKLGIKKLVEFADKILNKYDWRKIKHFPRRYEYEEGRVVLWKYANAIREGKMEGLSNKPKRNYKKASGLSNKVVNHLKGAKQVATNKKLTFSQKLRKLLEY